MAFSGTVAIRAMKDNDYVATIFPGTTAGLQAAIDHLAGGKGKVKVGPGTLETTTPIWLHSGAHLQGSGIGQTIIRRTGMVDGDAANSGAVLAVSAFGSNGTVPTSGTPQSNITISDLTVDGNYSLFGAVTQSNLVPAGIHTNYTDGVRISRVQALNCLGDGFRIRFCRNASLTDVEAISCGKWSITAAKNGVNFIGDYAGVGAWGYNYRLVGARIEDIGTGILAAESEAIQASGIKLMTVDDVEVDGCDYVFECSPTNIAVGEWGNWSISNIVARNVKAYFISINTGQATGYTLKNVSLTNLNIEGHATLHDAGVFVLPSTTGFYVDGFTIDGAHFRNINTVDVSVHNWFDSRTVDTTGHKNITLSRIKAFGVPGSTRDAGDIGINFQGAHEHIRLTDIDLQDVPGRGVMIQDNSVITNPVIREVILRDVTVDRCNEHGIQILSTSGGNTGTIQDVKLIDCTVRDCNLIHNPGAGFRLYNVAAAATLSKIYMRGCRTIKTAGNANFGFTILRSAGVVGELTFLDCDFVVTPSTDGLFFDTGVTNVHYTPRPGRGPNITALATIAIPVEGDTHHVTGNTNITNGITVRAWDNGRQITLIFDSTPTVSDTGTSILSAAFVATANDTLTLTCDGTNWYEVARSAN